ncbi:MAG: hypothetical protein IKZ93_04180 [Prevotella sp.]|nr:hypothetical protein [Prevotella sp.]
MKTYVQPWISRVEGEMEATLQTQSSDKALGVSQTEITDSDQILSKENSVYFDIWEDMEEDDGLEWE